MSVPDVFSTQLYSAKIQFFFSTRLSNYYLISLTYRQRLQLYITHTSVLALVCHLRKRSNISTENGRFRDD